MKRSIVVLALLVAPYAARLDAQGPPGQQGPQPAGAQPPDPFRGFLFPPELVMQHQGEINLQDSQRTSLQQAIQQAQTKFVDVQWKLSAEGEKLARLLQNATVDETQVLEQVDRILALERDMKRAQMGLMVRIKNTLTPAQQAKLRELRGEHRTD
jgi:Spy/CpxP family protein refolding chaperone